MRAHPTEGLQAVILLAGNAAEGRSLGHAVTVAWTLVHWRS